MNKLLILLIFFIGTALAEPENELIDIYDGEITNVLITLHFYDTYEELRADWPNWGPTLEGVSRCERNVEKDIAWCDIFVVRGMIVDGEHTLTLGHEVEHGIWGPRYHK